MLKKLLSTELSEEVLLSTPSSSNTLTLKEKLELAIKEKAVNNLTSHQSKDPNDLLSLVKQEMAFNYLMTIRPTSVDAERAFSDADAGAVVIKFQTQLNNNTIDKLCFLRSYFKHDPNLKI
jgi:hypothetical protein